MKWPTKIHFQAVILEGKQTGKKVLCEVTSRKVKVFTDQEYSFVIIVSYLDKKGIVLDCWSHKNVIGNSSFRSQILHRERKNLIKLPPLN